MHFSIYNRLLLCFLGKKKKIGTKSFVLEGFTWKCVLGKIKAMEVLNWPLKFLGFSTIENDSFNKLVSPGYISPVVYLIPYKNSCLLL